jgi:hypothetical protein
LKVADIPSFVSPFNFVRLKRSVIGGVLKDDDVVGTGESKFIPPKPARSRPKLFEFEGDCPNARFVGVADHIKMLGTHARPALVRRPQTPRRIRKSIQKRGAAH